MLSTSDGAPLLAINFSPDGIVSSISSSAENLLGYTPEDVLGVPVTQILADRSVFEVLEMINTARRHGAWRGTVVHRSKEGRPLEVHGQVVPLAGSDGLAESYLMLSSFTEPPQQGTPADAALKEVAAKLRSFAHELNNPLAVTMGFTQLILLNMGADGKNTADMERLYSEMKRLIQVVEKLQSYAISLQSDEPPQLDRKTS
jgi:PAS domain S-box-containing protein